MPYEECSSQRWSVRAAAEQIVVRQLDLIERKSHTDARVLLERIGLIQTLPQFAEHGVKEITAEALWKLVSITTAETANLAEELTGRPPIRANDWRLLLYCLTASRTLHEAISCAAEFLEALDGRLGSLHLEVHANVARVIVKGFRNPDSELSFAVALNGHMIYHGVFGWLIGQHLGGKAYLEFSDRHRALAKDIALPFELVLGSLEPAIEFPVTFLEYPVIRSISDCEAQPTLNFLFASRRIDQSHDIAERARRAIYLRLKNEKQLPKLEDLADMLGLGCMTLRRRLRAAGTSFMKIRDDCRRQMGLSLLRGTDLSVEEISVRLDFCDAGALRAAVNEWVGMSPTEYRRSIKTFPQ